MSDGETSLDSDSENLGRALICFIKETTKDDGSDRCGKNELKAPTLELEEVISMWEEDQEALK